MHRPRLNPYSAAIFLGTIAYPFIVYSYIDRLPPLFFMALALLLIALRIWNMRTTAARAMWVKALLCASVLLCVLMAVNSMLAVKAYPIVVSLSIAGLFGFSLLHPPTIIERFARISEPDLSDRGVRYTRKVTMVWLAFLLCNAAISAITALWGSMEQWTLWNGLISYLLMGLLFAGEYMVRCKVRQ